MAYNGKQLIGMRLALLRDFFNSHASKSKGVSLQQIKDFYTEQGFSASTNTVYADIRAVMDIFDMDIEYKNHKGYILHNPQFEPFELRLIVDSLQSSKFITQTTANNITKKIKAMTSEENRRLLNREAFVSDRIRSMNESVVRDSDKIYEAIASNRQISFRYFHKSPAAARKFTRIGKIYVVSPFALLWDSGNYYLYAYDSEKQKFRTFRVDRMDEISNPLMEKRDGVSEYDSKKLTHRKTYVFDAYQTDNVHNVEFICNNKMTDSVIDRFGNDILLMKMDDEHFRFTADIDLSPPFYAWVATFGKLIQIISPSEAVNGIKKFIKDVSEMYQDEGR